MNNLKALVAFFVTTLPLLGAASAHAAPANGISSLDAASCASLANMSIAASAIGLKTSGAVVQSATSVAAADSGNANGDYCQVKGIIKRVDPAAQDMQFEVNLPNTWNRRALQMGGGGYNGSLVTGLTGFTSQPASVANPLKQGYVTLGSDGGHQGLPGFDGRFGANDEMLANYGKESIKKTHDVALAIIQQAYGHKPNRFYFIGGSQGGHEALDAAARYPNDYDGVVANYPAYNVTLLHLGSLNLSKALYENGGAGWMNATHTKLITDAVYATCDALDGVTDGIIGNLKACEAKFDVSTLACPGGITGLTCLSTAQINAAKKIASDYRPGFPIAGIDSFGKWPLFEGALFSQVSTFGSTSTPSNPMTGNEAFLYGPADQTVKHIITRVPTFDPLTFDPAAWKTDIARAAAITDVSNVSLEPFRAKGGKIILTHGTVDDLITPYNTINYYNLQHSQFGKQDLSGFLKFYLIPGFGHGFGPFSAQYDGLALIQNWVENGVSPSNVVAVDGNAGANRTRPLCEYPSWPKFTGTDVNNAASYTCVTD
jgi:hypothetical protein